jgi:AAA15 family ATPase/GTPase
MVKEIKIQNYKSVQDLTLELGRINVLIGANGCGKSNILEAIAFGSAAADNKLDKEFLSARGIRVTEPKAMRSGFDKLSSSKDIVISFSNGNESTYINLNNANDKFSNWRRIFSGSELFDALIPEFGLLIKSVQEKIEPSNNKENEIYLTELEQLIEKLPKKIQEKESVYFNFLIYAPENTFLRRFEDEERTSPIGIRGEGLFDLLNEMSQNQPEEFQEIIENLELIDWFEGFEIPKDLVFTERRIRIKDRFLEEGLQYFDQRSSNEGFLFLMFYFALFISKYTPKFFAIDNIDASLNPKLCIEFIKILTKLAKKHDKQVIFTTHNPAILDGLNLNDDEVRLLVVNRNIHGHTKVKRVLKKEMPEGVEPLRLSEQFLRGYLGGLPKNF